MSSLVFIKETTGSSVDAISVTDVFSADYDVYQIVIDKSGSTNNTSNVRFIKASDDSLIDAGYDWAYKNMYTHTTHADSQQGGQPEIQGAFGGVGTEGGGISYVFNPFEATYTYIIGQSSQDAGSTTPATPAKSNGVLKNAVSVSGIRVLSGSGTYGTIRVRVYGVTR